MVPTITLAMSGSEWQLVTVARTITIRYVFFETAWLWHIHVYYILRMGTSLETTCKGKLNINVAVVGHCL